MRFLLGSRPREWLTIEMSLELRSATKEDGRAIFDLIKGLADYERLSDEVTGSVEKLVENLFHKPLCGEVILAIWEGEPVGFALFFHNFSTFLCQPGLYLEDLFVQPEFRGNGIGLALISAVGKIAEERGCGRVEWSVLDWNKPSIEFYRELGARSMDGWTSMRVEGSGISGLASASSVGIT